MRAVRVAAVQFEPAARCKETNLEKIHHFVEKAANRGVEILAFPECCLTGYWYLRHLTRSELEELAEPVFDGPSTQELLALSRKYQLSIGAGLIERARDGALYNTYVFAMPDGQRQRHRKLHAFISPHVSSGSEFTVFDTPHGCRAGILTCYDNNICENVRINALQGAEILLAPHQTGGCASPNPHTMGLINRDLWENRHSDPESIEAELRGPKGRSWLLRWLPARAHDNGLFLIFSNAIGIDDDEIRTGNSMIIDPYGRILAETWKAGEDLVTAVLDPSLLEDCTGRRWMKTRRSELYGLITKKLDIEEETRAVRFDRKGV